MRSADITLYEANYISGTIQEDWIFQTDHHYIIEDDTDFHPSFSLEIQPGAVIRINPGVDLVIHGNLTAQGEENNMFWVTSNSGLENSQLTIQNSPLSSEDIYLYNSMELSDLANVEDDLIEWGKWDYGNTCFQSIVNNLHMQNGIFRKGNCGFYSSSVDSMFSHNVVFYKNKEVGFQSENGLKVNVENNVLVLNNTAVLTKEYSYIKICNNFFKFNTIAFADVGCTGIIEHNTYLENECDIELYGSYSLVQEDLIINYNELFSNSGIITNYLPYYGYYFNTFCSNNNFFNLNWFIYISHDIYEGDFICENNYFDGLNNIEDIENRIFDYDDNPEFANVEVLNFEIFQINNAGVQ